MNYQTIEEKDYENWADDLRTACESPGATRGNLLSFIGELEMNEKGKAEIQRVLGRDFRVSDWETIQDLLALVVQLAMRTANRDELAVETCFRDFDSYHNERRWERAGEAEDRAIDEHRDEQAMKAMEGRE